MSSVIKVALVTIFAGGLWRREGIGSTGGLFCFSVPVGGSGFFGPLEKYIEGAPTLRIVGRWWMITGIDQQQIEDTPAASINEE